MTRSESLYIAISIISDSNHPEKSKIIEGLQKCIHTLSNRKWTEETIMDACNEVYQAKGFLLASDFKRKNMPSHTDIAQVFHMTAKQFRDTYYPSKTDVPTNSPFYTHSISEWTSMFLEDYKRIHPKTQAEYNKFRSPSLPTWNTIAKMNGVTSWNSLLILLGLKHNYNTPIDFCITCNFTKK